jgi:hypothetical protein
MLCFCFFRPVVRCHISFLDVTNLQIEISTKQWRDLSDPWDYTYVGKWSTRARDAKERRTGTGRKEEGRRLFITSCTGARNTEAKKSSDGFCPLRPGREVQAVRLLPVVTGRLSLNSRASSSFLWTQPTRQDASCDSGPFDIRFRYSAGHLVRTNLMTYYARGES